MQRLVIASFLVAATQIATAQPADQTSPPPEGEGKATEPAKDPAGDKKKPDPDAGKAGEPAESEPEEDKPAEPPPEEKPAVSAVYNNGLEFESSDKKYGMKLLFRNQMRFESLRPTETGSQFLNHFYIARSRFQAEGHVFGDADRYKLELGLGDSGNFSFIKDMFLEHRLSDAPVWLRFGQWKRPFNRQEMVSDFASEFNERSIENDLAGGGRDLGVALHNDYEKTAEGIEWVLGMFNGFSGGSDKPKIASVCTTNPATGAVTCLNGNPTTFSTDFQPAVVARAGWNSARAKGYSEADLEGGPLRYSVAAAYKIDLANFAKGAQPSLAKNLSHGLELDWNIKNNGLSISGGLVMMKLKSANAQYGFVIQPGLMVIPKHAEVAARFALTTQPGDRKAIEALGAFNYFVHGHHLKIASDFGILKTTGTDPMTMATDKPDIRVRIMGQMEI